MRAAHLHTQGIHDDNEAAAVEMIVRLAEGVSDVASIRSLELVSVLYDESKTCLPSILGAVRAAGFDAHAYETAEQPQLAS